MPVLHQQGKAVLITIAVKVGDGSKPVDTFGIKPPVVPPVGDSDSTRQGGAMFLESSFFPASQNFFLGVLRALSDHLGREVQQFSDPEKVSTSFSGKMNHPVNCECKKSYGPKSTPQDHSITS